MRKLTNQELVTRQENQPSSQIPLVVVANNIRSLENVGSLFRTCDGLGIQRLWLCGITGIPPATKITKTALGAEEVVDWKFHERADVLLAELKEQGYEIVLLEQTTKSIPYTSYQPTRPVALVLGNEIDGVDDNLLTLADQSIEIEMAGQKNSLNVTVAFGVVGYYLREQMV